jgi:hypothetical protein
MWAELLSLPNSRRVLVTVSTIRTKRMLCSTISGTTSPSLPTTKSKKEGDRESDRTILPTLWEPAISMQVC